jgi:hypothetical protein
MFLGHAAHFRRPMVALSQCIMKKGQKIVLLIEAESDPDIQPAPTPVAVGWFPPSTRIPVTQENRELLRELRAAELAIWENLG